MKKKTEKKPDPFAVLQVTVKDLIKKHDEQKHENRMLKMVIRSQQLRIEIQRAEMQIISLNHWIDIHGAKNDLTGRGDAQKNAGGLLLTGR